MSTNDTPPEDSPAPEQLNVAPDATPGEITVAAKDSSDHRARVERARDTLQRMYRFFRQLDRKRPRP